ncbi:MAG: glycosyltransferase [Acidimicrobiia bacterium]
MTNVLLATSNGTGMGHLTRQAAVALSFGPGDRPTLFSLSIGLPLTLALGVNGEYCPSYDRPWLASSSWNSYLRDRLVAIIEETACDVVVFDGVAPYPGIGAATALVRDVAFIWLRRGMWRTGIGSKHLRRASYFDLVVEPADLGEPDASSDSSIRRVGPISLIEVLDPIPRDEARKELGLPPDGEIALVTLGSGRLGDVAGPGRVAVETLLSHGDMHVAVTRSAVAQNEVPLDVADRITEIRDTYPLVRYLNAFDLAVSSSGYNAVHELIPAGIPTLFVANTSTRTDDQVARARGVATKGLGFHANDDDPAGVETGLRSLLDTEERSATSRAATATRATLTGASDTARLAVEYGSSFTRRRQSARAVVDGQIQRVKDMVKGALGDERTEAVKRMLGRAPTPIGKRSQVRIVDSAETAAAPPIPLVVTEQVTGDDLRGDSPVEHLLPGSSQTYRQTRLAIIDHYYDVVG